MINKPTPKAPAKKSAPEAPTRKPASKASDDTKAFHDIRTIYSRFA